MPAIWSSSERSLSVRMVWVDGIRHAILSRDDPLLRSKSSHIRPGSTPSSKKQSYLGEFVPYKPITQATNRFDSGLITLRLVGENNRMQGSQSTRKMWPRQQSAPSASRSGYNIQDPHFASSSKLMSEHKTSEIDIPENYEFLIIPEKDEAKFVEIPLSNTLSEQVIQWLDLSGKVRDKDPDNSCVSKRLYKCKLSSLKVENSCAKVLIPTQFLILQERSATEHLKVSQMLLKRHRRKSNKKPRTRDISPASDEDEHHIHEDLDADEDIRSLWSLSGRPQLHIFMPIMKPTDIKWISSQDSLSCE